MDIYSTQRGVITGRSEAKLAPDIVLGDGLTQSPLLKSPSPSADAALHQSFMNIAGEHDAAMHVAIVDTDWTILAANAAWLQSPSIEPAYSVLGIGGNFRQFLEQRAAKGGVDAARVLGRLRLLDRGEVRQLRDMVSVDDTRERIDISISRIDTVTGCFAVISCTNISELRQLRLKQRRLTRRFLKVQEDERRRVARDLHDSSAQYLVGMSLGLASLEACDLPPRVSAMVSDLGSLLQLFYRDLRGMTFMMHPPELHPGDLPGAVKAICTGFAARSDTKVNVRVFDRSVGVPILPEVEAAIYRIVQEALANVQKHAKASKVNVRLELRPNIAIVVISDNGIGMKTLTVPDGGAVASIGVGISGMIARVTELGGRLSVHSAAHRRGTLLAAAIPNSDG
ncbi:MAG: hypothetical protein EOP18_01130 [Rhizobiaceae bacterium]|nr:MAG: hypothetical protein EOP18_01130 [Rhizobiaceae bacterium]